MAEKFNPDSFTSFLKTVKRAETATPPDTPVAALLKLLAAAQDKRMEASALLSASEMSVETFARTLAGLEKASLVVTEREDTSQVVRLTTAGEIVAAQS